MTKDVIPDERPDEEIILTSRQHPWVLFKPAFIIIVSILFVVLFFMIFGLSDFTIGLLIIWVAFVIIYGPLVWYAYSNDLFILTNQRIIKIDQKGFLYRKVSETELDNAYNVNYEIKGLMKNLLNFGTIKISTVGDELSTIEIKNLENPHFVQERIMDLHKKYKMKVYSS